ncbi:hypothetical protein BT63DRAFT_423486 [Microthyrium microscopicum]|uniref:histidine kinase n=1 Tax=Microthyrium microscopicum TaxID=703497 RepID=A0A6A6UK61_9PEZI|nr:hypothetical protein BT63DRAFT_423486 [Microthyrium microscopicum]
MSGLVEAPWRPEETATTTTTSGRQTLCITTSKADVVLQNGDQGFHKEVLRFWSQDENNAAEALIHLKARLRTIRNNDFWTSATEGFAELLGAQYAFISKRLDVFDQNLDTELTESKPEDCLMGMSIYFNDGRGFENNSKDIKYFAFGSPCAHMRHNKVLLIPENLPAVCPNNANELPAEPESYLAVPLSYLPPNSSSAIVYGHFGVMWTPQGNAERKLSYSCIENILHSLEDLIASRFEELGYLDDLKHRKVQRVQMATPPASTRDTASLHNPVAAALSLKPFARSLSHELRTPMQGVIGMLDLMHARVQEATEDFVDPRVAAIFQDLRENIEIVQDSARRAVEAADNVVHAYDMNMTVPEASMNENDEEIYSPHLGSETSSQPTPSGNIATRGHKRNRSSLDVILDKPSKIQRVQSSAQLLRDSTNSSTATLEQSLTPGFGTPQLEGSPSGSVSGERHIAPGVRQTVITDMLQNLFTDALKVGGRPESAIAQPIEGGEEIEVRQRSASGEEKVKLVRWTIDPAVPDTILIDERDLTGLLSRVLHNAFKFTESGHITTTIRLSPKGKYIIINVADTGTGIPDAFKPYLFRAFSKEDDSITRQSEGLGLGLMVAKGLARRLNGDLYNVRSEISGPNRGTEFEMKIPLTPGDVVSRPSTPFGSRSPSSNARSVDPELPVPNGLSNQNLKSPQPRKSSTVRHARSNSLLSRVAPNPGYTPSTHPIIPHTHPANSRPLYISTANAPTPPSPLSTPRIPEILNLEPCPTQPVQPRLPKRHAKRKLAHNLPLSFLVVEDNHVLRKVLVQMLRNFGYAHVHTAYDGADAIRQMELHHKRVLSGEALYEIDVVLMDLWMPTMTGYQAAEYILKHSAENMPLHDAKSLGGWKTPVIMAVTADMTDEAIVNVSKAGMRGPLMKPYTILDLERTLWELCAPTVAITTTSVGA